MLKRDGLDDDAGTTDKCFGLAYAVGAEPPFNHHE